MCNSELKRDRPGEKLSCFQMSEAMRPMRALETECRRGQEPNRAESEETSSLEMGEGQPASGE